MAKYKVPIRFIFSATFTVEAKSASDARLLVDENCGLVLGGDIHSTLNDEDVEWECYKHPDREYGKITKSK